MKKRKATPRQESSPKKSHDMPSHIQRARILEALLKAGGKGKSTIQLREELDIMHPGGRVLELREARHRIETVWTVTGNAQGHQHRCARYVLFASKAGAAA